MYNFDNFCFVKMAKNGAFNLLIFVCLMHINHWGLFKFKAILYNLTKNCGNKGFILFLKILRVGVELELVSFDVIGIYFIYYVTGIPQLLVGVI